MLRTKIRRSQMRDKQHLFRRGETLVNTFCEFNSLPPPRIEEANLRSTPGTQKGRQIKIDLGKCTGALFTQNTNRWSFPGHIMDSTPYGEVCRQFGYYLLHRFKRKDPLFRMRGATKILGYERTEELAFAEAVRLYLTNSDLLHLVSDKRYWALRAGLRLKPIVDDPWNTVLEESHAPNKYTKLVINTYNNEREEEKYMTPLATELTENYSFTELQLVKDHLIAILKRNRELTVEGKTKTGKKFSLQISKNGKEAEYSLSRENLHNTNGREVTENAAAIHMANDFAHACLLHEKPLGPYQVASNMRRYNKTEINLKKYAGKAVKKKKGNKE